MGAIVFKQPNGLYGRYSTVVDDFTHYNMTEEEYKIVNIEKSIRDSEDTLKNYTRTKYEEVLKDHEGILKLQESYQHEKGLTKKEREKEKQEHEKNVQEFEELKRAMESNDSIDELSQEYFKTVYELVDNLCCFYDKDWNKKKYQILNNPKDMKDLIPRLKLINEMFKLYENTQSRRNKKNTKG